MAKAVKYSSYEEWVCGRLARCRNKTMNTALLMKLPQYLYDMEVEPTKYDLEQRLRRLRDQGIISVSSQQWTLRGPYVAPPPRKPKTGPKPDPRQLVFEPLRDR